MGAIIPVGSSGGAPTDAPPGAWPLGNSALITTSTTTTFGALPGWVPGTEYARVRCVGPGGDGATDSGSGAAGGAGGGVAVKTVYKRGGLDSVSLAFTPAAGGSEAASTLTISELGVSLTANGGPNATGTTGPAGGTASGGDYNLTGGKGGDSAGGTNQRRNGGGGGAPIFVNKPGGKGGDGSIANGCGAGAGAHGDGEGDTAGGGAAGGGALSAPGGGFSGNGVDSGVRYGAGNFDVPYEDGTAVTGSYESPGTGGPGGTSGAGGDGGFGCGGGGARGNNGGGGDGGVAGGGGACGEGQAAGNGGPGGGGAGGGTPGSGGDGFAIVEWS